MRKCGILAHPISVPSRYGIGDLGKGCTDLIDYMKRAGQKLWQILPLGHTGFGNSPYQSFSTFAGNPLLISPDILLEKGYLSESDLMDIPQFNQDCIEYGKVIEYKNILYKKAYKTFKNKKNKIYINEYKNYCEKNSFWLDDYALFMSLKNYFIQQRANTFESAEYKEYYKKAVKYMEVNSIKDCFYGGCWNSFPVDIRDREPNAVKKYTDKLKNEIEYYKFLQYEFYTQWQIIKEYANENGIEVIGDIPIFVASDSSDTWSSRELFYINEEGFTTEVAGVPPDYFSEDGQLWGNPLYNWSVHKARGYSWWVQRVECILDMVDIVRIDHFRAFESYWSVPFGEKTAINGKWKRGPKKAVFKAIKDKLGTLNIIAEDLGDLNKEVLELRDALGLPGMKILQFAFGESSNDYLPHNYNNDNYVVYTGTHDNDTTIGWYENIDDKTKDYVRRLLNVSGEDINWDMIRLAIASCARYAVIPIQDIMGLDSEARMNTPGVGEGNWQFRYRENMLSESSAAGLKYLCEIFNRY